MLNNIKILLVDDEVDILDFLGYRLKKEGYQVFTSTTGFNAIQIATTIQPHLILLDIMLPGIDGIEVCKTLRTFPAMTNTRIIFLTASHDDRKEINGLESGGDDYIKKPIKLSILLSRIKAILRRSKAASKLQLEFNGLRIDKEKMQVYTNGQTLNLPKKVFLLLELLVSKPGKVFSREMILQTVWGTNTIVGNRTVDVHIRKLRESIGDQYILTIKGVGYKFLE